MHPLQLLSAHLTYGSGHGVRGSLTWTPDRATVDALDGAFYDSFQHVEPTGKRLLLALDVSASMTSGGVGGVPGLTPRKASVVMAMVQARTEAPFNWQCVGFTSGDGQQWGRGTALCELTVSPTQRLDDICRSLDRIPFGGTDCSLPIRYAHDMNREFDAFVVYTDSETQHGPIHPHQALTAYRKKTGINAKSAVVGMVSNGFSIANPADTGMLDFVGFDSAAPAVLADFIRKD
jgi:60 kDa SS-A/Ro ribonucleoprotein